MTSNKNNPAVSGPRFTGAHENSSPLSGSAKTLFPEHAKLLQCWDIDPEQAREVFGMWSATAAASHPCMPPDAPQSGASMVVPTFDPITGEEAGAMFYQPGEEDAPGKETLLPDLDRTPFVPREDWAETTDLPLIMTDDPLAAQKYSLDGGHLVVGLLNAELGARDTRCEEERLHPLLAKLYLKRRVYLVFQATQDAKAQQGRALATRLLTAAGAEVVCVDAPAPGEPLTSERLEKATPAAPLPWVRWVVQTAWDAKLDQQNRITKDMRHRACREEVNVLLRNEEFLHAFASADKLDVQAIVNELFDSAAMPKRTVRKILKAFKETLKNDVNDDRPEILIGAEEHLTVSACIDALARWGHPDTSGGVGTEQRTEVPLDLYQFDKKLVELHLSYPDPFKKEITRYVAEPVTRERMSELITKVARLYKLDPDGVPVRTTPTARLPQQVLDRRDWPALQHLTAIVDHPVLLSSGNLVSKKGYDPVTGLFITEETEVPPPSIAAAREAVATFKSLFRDFPFLTPADLSAMVTALVTVVTRYAVDGPVPCVVITAPVKGIGKTLLGEVVARIATGRPMPQLTPRRTPGIGHEELDQVELEKVITAKLAAGDRIACIDNAKVVGGATINVFLTAEDWEGRELGHSKMWRGPNRMCLFVTGIGVQVLDETSRRTMLVRLQGQLDAEKRDGFEIKDLKNFTRENRHRYLAAALTIVQSYIAAGAPDQGLPAIGSYEAWSAKVRSAVVWAGLPDPLESWNGADVYDPESHAYELLLLGIAAVNKEKNGYPVTAREMLGRVESTPEHHAVLAGGIDLIGSDRMSPKTLASRLNSDYVDRPSTSGRILRARKIESGLGFYVEANELDQRTAQRQT